MLDFKACLMFTMVLPGKANTHEC